MTFYRQTFTPLTAVDILIDDELDPDLIIMEPEALPRDLVQQRMTILVAFVVIAVTLFGLFVGARWRLNGSGSVVAEMDTAASAPVVQAVPAAPVGLISPIFSPEVQYWEKEILQWSAQYNVDPNMAATIMQIESCGDLQAVSVSGAQGLFQVMPFHFSDGEDMVDPNTNARRGLNFFAEQLKRFGDVNLAFAAYNGGPGNAVKSYEDWPRETQRYHYWSQGIYADVLAGLTSSSRLQEWMQAGGASLCRQAANRLGLQ
jgi:hypothetical protein